MLKQWKLLPFWQTGEWQVISERLGNFTDVNPAHPYFLRPLRELAPHAIRVVIFGQDPYPDPLAATGQAFEVSSCAETLPPTLVNIFKEYVSDLKYPEPSSGSLQPWIDQGVFLWNVIPTCSSYKSLSHDWVEWEPLNKDIIDLITKANEPFGGVVWVFLGGVARRYVKYITDGSPILEYSHPSPRGAYSGNNPFMGSRMFSTINDLLCSIGRPIIDWKLVKTELPDTRGIPDPCQKVLTNAEELLNQETQSTGEGSQPA